MANTIYKRVSMCKGYLNVPLDFSPYSVNWYVEVEGGTFPPQMDGVLSVGRGWSSVFINTTHNGGYGVRALVLRLYDGNGGAFLGYFEIDIDVEATCISETETCCTNAVAIRWLGVVGGIKEWPFPGVRDFEVRVGNANTFKNSALQIQYSQRKDIYAGKSINSKSVTKQQYDFLTELKVAIQAWEWNTITSTWDAILFDNESFATYKSNTHIREFSARYIIAAESIIQTQ